jgi:flagellar biosynthesis protein FlhF
MKIQRIFAENARLAAREVRKTLGPEAVILSNRCVDGGVELVAAIDYDEHELETYEAESALGEIAASPDMTHVSQPVGCVRSVTPLSASSSQRAVQNPTTEPRNQTGDATIKGMRAELREMRELLELGICGMAWSDYRRTTPASATLLGRLLDYGLGPQLCNRILDDVGDSRLHEFCEDRVSHWLSAQLRESADDVLTDGGVLALVGPTGVGKTTTVAKIAARFTLTHGPNQVALVTTDSYRIGALEQLHTFGRILGMPVRLVRDGHELQSALEQFSDRRLVLIDTAGMSPRDLHVAEQIGLLQSTVHSVRSYLVLAANAQMAALEETVAAFAPAQPSACVLTKLDEARRLGGVLSTVIDAGLPLALASAGQRVPEDLERADPAALVAQGWTLMGGQSSPPDQNVLALAFGTRMAHAYA